MDEWWPGLVYPHMKYEIVRIIIFLLNNAHASCFCKAFILANDSSIFLLVREVSETKNYAQIRWHLLRRMKGEKKAQQPSFRSATKPINDLESHVCSISLLFIATEQPAKQQQTAARQYERNEKKNRNRLSSYTMQD